MSRTGSRSAAGCGRSTGSAEHGGTAEDGGECAIAAATSSLWASITGATAAIAVELPQMALPVATRERRHTMVEAEGAADQVAGDQRDGGNRQDGAEEDWGRCGRRGRPSTEAPRRTTATSSKQEAAARSDARLPAIAGRPRGPYQGPEDDRQYNRVEIRALEDPGEEPQ